MGLGRKQVHIGCFAAEQEAAQEYDAAVRQAVRDLLGDSASADAWLIRGAHNKMGRQLKGLNFPTQPEFDARPKPL